MTKELFLLIVGVGMFWLTFLTVMKSPSPYELSDFQLKVVLLVAFIFALSGVSCITIAAVGYYQSLPSI